MGKRVEIDMSLRSTDFNANVKQTQRELATLRQEIRNASDTINNYEKDVESLGKKYDAVNKALETSQKSVSMYKDEIGKLSGVQQNQIKELEQLRIKKNDLTKAYEDSIKQYGAEATETEKLKKALNEVTKEYDAKEKALDNTSKKLANYQVELSKAEGSVQRYAKQLIDTKKQQLEMSDGFVQASIKLGDASKKFTAIGGVMDDVGNKALGIAAPILTATALIGSFSMDVENSFAKVSSITSTTGQAFENMKDSLIKLSNETGVPIQQLAEGMYDVISAGRDGEAGMKMLEISTKLAVAGFTEAKSSAGLLSAIMNSFKLETEETETVSSKLLLTQNLGVITVAEMAQVYGRLLPSVKACGLDLDNLSASMIILTKNGINSAEASTMLKNLFDETSKSGSKLDEALREVSGKGMKELVDEGANLSDIMKMIQQYADNNSLDVATLFSSSESLTAFRTLIDNTDEYKVALEKVANASGLVDGAFNKLQDTSGAKLDIAINELKNSFLSLSDNIAPVIAGVTGAIETLGKVIGSLPDGVVDSVIQVGLLSGGLGILGKSFGAVSTLTGGFLDKLSLITSFLGNNRISKDIGVFSDLTKVFSGVEKGVGDSTKKIIDNLDIFGEDASGVFAFLNKETLKSSEESKKAMDAWNNYLSKGGDIFRKSNTEIVEEFGKFSEQYGRYFDNISMYGKNSKGELVEPFEFLRDGVNVTSEAIGKSMEKSKSSFTGFVSSVTGLSTSTVVSLTTITGVVALVAGAFYTLHEAMDVNNASVIKSKEEFTGFERILASLMGVQLKSKEELENMGLVYNDFNENISEDFRGSVEDMRDDIADFNLALSETSLDGVFSEDEVNILTDRVQSAVDSSITAIEQKQEESNTALSELFNTDGVFTEKEKSMMEWWATRGDKEKQEALTLQQEISDIEQTAFAEGRALTSEEEQAIMERYERIKQIELIAKAKNTDELTYAQIDFQNQVATLDAEGASELMKQKLAQAEELKLAKKNEFDMLKAQAMEGYEQMSEEDKRRADEFVSELDSSWNDYCAKDQEYRQNLYKQAIEGNANLQGAINKFNGEILANEDKQYYERYCLAQDHYVGLDKITESGYSKVYDKSSKTWKEVYASVDSVTGKLIGLYDLNSGEVASMTQKDAMQLSNLGNAFTYTQDTIKDAMLGSSKAFVDNSGRIRDESNKIVGSLKDMKTNVDGTKQGIIELNGQKVRVNVDKNGTITNLNEIQNKINGIYGKNVNVGVYYKEYGRPQAFNAGNGYYQYAWASGTPSAPEGASLVNELGWETFSVPKGVKEPYAIGNSIDYVAEGTRINSHLQSLEQMRTDIKKEVARQQSSISSTDINNMTNKIVRAIKESYAKDIQINNAFNIENQVEEGFEEERLGNNISKVISTELRRFGKVKVR